MRSIKAIILFLYIYLFLLISKIGLEFISSEESEFYHLKIIPNKIIPIIFLVWLVVFICSVIFNIKNTKKLFKENNVTGLIKNCKLIKLTLIPFWVLHFVASFILMGAIIAATRGIGFLFVPIPIFFTYIFLIITSVFSIPLIVLL